MSRTVKEVSMFPPGTPESAIFAIQGLRGSADSVESCTSSGSEERGWIMTTVWTLPTARTVCNSRLHAGSPGLP